MRSRCTFAVLGTLLVTVAACDVPRFQGPEIQEPPPGFLRQPDTPAKRDLFPEHEPTSHTAWVHTDFGGVSVISVDGYATAFTLDDVMAAREAAEAAESDPDAIFDQVEAIRIDDRDGWGWYERVESNRRGREQVTYTAVVPYDSVSYAIEFVSGEPSLKRAAPDTLRQVVRTFAIGRTTYNIPLIAIVLGGVLLLVSALRARSRERADRLRSINLVTIPTGKEGGEPDLSEATTTAESPTAGESPSPDPLPADTAQPPGPAPRTTPPPRTPPDPDPPDPSAGS